MPLNVADRLSEQAERRPDAVAIACPQGYDRERRRQYAQITFRELDEETDRLARGLIELGARPGARIALLARPSIEFVALVFALLKSGAVTILIDPGMGRRNLLGCLDAAQPEGFVAVPAVHAVRAMVGRRFRRARINVTVGRRLFWNGVTLDERREIGRASRARLPETRADDPAAIIFTTGSTGPPKGVQYLHEMFDTQVAEIRDFYGIEPGEIDLPGFPLFGLFNCAMGVTTVIPDMNPSRPARVEPKKIIEAVRDWNVTQAFGSPAIWNRVGRYCRQHQEKLPSLRRVLSAGAPVPGHVLDRMRDCIHPEGEVHTPYGATEALPVASISASEVLGETQARTDRGAGVCVGRKFPQIEWRIIRVTDAPIDHIDRAEPLPQGEIGELIVRGPQVTRAYATRAEWNARAKIIEGHTFWHRMGDVGYFDEQGRFWFCGRKAHRVATEHGAMFTVPCEAIINTHPAVFRSALVGGGPPGRQTPVIVAEPHAENWPRDAAARRRLLAELRDLAAQYPTTAPIRHFLLRRALPVDIRHNAKIFREKLAPWAAKLVVGG
jgi:acyl-CoA synthetase (AMP-forming)/AMP-acid ligase II